ncbi:MAG: homoserine O-acetyltransferase family protein [Wenzhouxiangella sp.]
MSAPIQRLRIPSPPPLLGGGRLRTLGIGYRTWGRLDPDGDNAVLVCPALTGDSDLAHWWPALLGPGRALDPQRDFIICADVLGGSGRTTGPGSRAADGQPWGERFPEITVRDMVQVQGLLLDRLGVTRLKLVIGGSLGGMQVLEWLVSAHQRIDAAVVIAAAARQSPWARAFNHVQRRALMQHGDIELARMVAMLSYRHWDNLDGRFDQPERQPHPAEDWLNHHGLALKSRFDPTSYQRLMGAMDSHDLGRDRGGWERALTAISTPVQLIGIQSDLLYPPRDQQRLADALPNAWLDWLEADQGHDAFLIEQARINRLVTEFRHSLDEQRQPLIRVTG